MLCCLNLCGCFPAMLNYFCFREEYEAKKKRKMDPLCGMMGYLAQTRKVIERRSGEEGTHEKVGVGDLHYNSEYIGKEVPSHN